MLKVALLHAISISNSMLGFNMHNHNSNNIAMFHDVLMFFFLARALFGVHGERP